MRLHFSKAWFLTSDTSGKTYTCKAISAGGTTTKSVTVKRDATLPTTTITAPAVNATYAFNQVVNASYTCTDAMSKVASCSGTVVNGQAINTGPGQYRGTRDACYNCHPGRDTDCQRGAMGNPVDSTGKHTMECQSCHGSMATVGNKARIGWFDMPTCQSCHHDGKRETVAINSNGTFKTWTDTRFASNTNTPVTGSSLYRYGTGHSSMQCEACHTTMPNTVNGGPHGMHTLGQSWVTSHYDAFNTTAKSTCYVCHGSTSSGSPLAVVKVAKTLNGKTFAAGDWVTCWSCHNGPNP